mmetsp:Transcript_19981/g.32950  ORF Transcript_19981/g.32950 Transcript_19981/m.32950 type:complete len:381 (+) Transcript_19981:207-1349(+)|eukprot:CAMPEP_0203759822 /NCGR_PEP_ID=MMETSP0098-20131031/13060_1 /ASSEMBLY_ACC=CAM_ASM_000208 /TAXON_ID=96639 /ORGANISM=" , Strain NY0313808BC1" /LENGTH=380 /DNA_ID=CAMNT_0050653057 /DNA_START=184 /DNA_END=1326 /DNA_ORIENTATION=+
MPPAVTRSAAKETSRNGVSVSKAKQVELHGHMFNTEAPKPRPNAHDLDILTGDHGLEEQVKLKDFIWTLTDEPHAARRKEMIKELGPKIQSLMGHEPMTKYYVTVLLLIHIGIGIWIRDDALWGGTLKFWLVAYVFGGSLAQNLFLANHEVSHNLAFKSQWANKVYGIIVNTPMLVPYFISFKGYHAEHHKLQGTDGIDADLPTELEARLLSSIPGKLFYMFNQTWFYAFRPVFMKPQPFTAWHGLNVVVQVVFVYAIVQLFGWGPVFYFLASAHFAGSWHPLASHFIAEHYTFVGEAETASYYGPLNKLTWNVGLHNEHHDFPYVPWSRLHELRRIGAKWYDPIPYHKSWTGALWHFLFSPDVTMYNRVKREQKDIKSN